MWQMLRKYMGGGSARQARQSCGVLPPAWQREWTMQQLRRRARALANAWGCSRRKAQLQKTRGEMAGLFQARRYWNACVGISRPCQKTMEGLHSQLSRVKGL